MQTDEEEGAIVRARKKLEESLRRLEQETKSYVEKSKVEMEEAILYAESMMKLMEDEIRKTEMEKQKREFMELAMEALKKDMHESERKALEEGRQRIEALEEEIERTKHAQFTSEEIELMKDSLVGEGRYGKVYKGKLHHTDVAVKVLNGDAALDKQEFERQVEIVSRLHHPHLVMLLGWCTEGEHACLVYEYLENGSLEDRLKCRNNSRPLPAHARYRIAAEIARGLLYLHKTKPEAIVHCDLRSGNILLDRNLSSKIDNVGVCSLFPLSRFVRHTVAAADVYIDPACVEEGLTPQSDVYSLGVILLELLTGCDREEGMIERVSQAVAGDSLRGVLDPRAQDWPLDAAMNLACIALQCVQVAPCNRPQLECVLDMLECIHLVEDEEDKPPEHFLCPISQDVMENPVVAADGYTYEYQAIYQWLRNKHTSPMTNLPMRNHNFIENRNLKSAIREWQVKRM